MKSHKGQWKFPWTWQRGTITTPQTLNGRASWEDLSYEVSASQTRGSCTWCLLNLLITLASAFYDQNWRSRQHSSIFLITGLRAYKIRRIAQCKFRGQVKDTKYIIIWCAVICNSLFFQGRDWSFEFFLLIPPLSLAFGLLPLKLKLLCWSDSL